ncbi:MAG: hypothetical protein JWR50_3272, partial [Mucilaginibacter sp.]|nr:hypothetical protein [Mucilaginibacter sp.]
MNIIAKKVNCLLFYILLLAPVTPALAQNNHASSGAPSQFKSFTTALAQINLAFTFPEGFKEIKAPATESFPFDYAMELPDADFEIWFRINTQKESEKLIIEKNIHVANPDSLYVRLAEDQIAAFTSDNTYLKRKLPDYILNRYNADDGSTFLMDLNDSPITKHYKYALLTVLEKTNVGIVLAICFSNEKGPDFF